MDLKVNNHEHDWEVFPPATVGATPVSQCKTCGLYESFTSPPKSDNDNIFHDLRRMTAGITGEVNGL